ncbi:unnamed protein product [Urochloa humidicola]
MAQSSTRMVVVFLAALVLAAASLPAATAYGCYDDCRWPPGVRPRQPSRPSHGGAVCERGGAGSIQPARSGGSQYAGSAACLVHAHSDSNQCRRLSCIHAMSAIT